MPIRAAIIGAGPSGLISIKQCLDDDIEPVCFEVQGHIGGQWRYTELDPKTGEAVSSVYRSTIINTSRDTMCMSDFPMDPKEYPIYLHHTKVFEYFESYATFFNLYPRIRFHHRVVSVTPLLGNKWLVQTKSDEEEISEEVFDTVFICSGHHSRPNIPDWEGVEVFKRNGGEILHSHYYRDSRPYVGENVAVVGIGNSGVDISSDLSTVAGDTHLITRSGAWVWPRFLLGWAYESFLFKSDLFERIEAGRIKPHRAEILRFFENGVELTNGERIEPLKKIIACTGYQLSFPYLSHDIYQCKTDDVNWVHLYRMVVPPEYPTLFFIGLVQPLGAIMPVSEQQARWATSILHGHITLPPSLDMLKDIEQYKRGIRARYLNSPRHTIQVDFLAYNDTLAEDLGTNIRLWKFIQTFGLSQGLKTMIAVYFGLPSSAQFRLFGRGSRSELARLCVQRVYKDQGAAMKEEERKEMEKFKNIDK